MEQDTNAVVQSDTKASTVKNEVHVSQTHVQTVVRASKHKVASSVYVKRVTVESLVQCVTAVNQMCVRMERSVLSVIMDLSASVYQGTKEHTATN